MDDAEIRDRLTALLADMERGLQALDAARDARLAALLQALALLRAELVSALAAVTDGD